MAVIDIDFPGNIGQVDTVDDLRGLPSYFFTDNLLYIVLDAGFYQWDPSSLATDDGVTVLKPYDKTSLQAGRWLLSASISVGSLRSELEAPGGSNQVGFSHAATADPGTAAAHMKRFILASDAPYLASTSKTPAQNTAAIQAAIDDIEDAGGGALIVDDFYTVGQSTLSETYDNEGFPISASGACIIVRSHVSLIALEGKGGLTADSNGTLSLLYLISPDGMTIRGLTLDAAWNGVNGAGHAIIQFQLPGAEYCRNLTIEFCKIRNSASYGIGIENGDISNLTIAENDIFNVGADGIDIKGRGPSGGEQPSINIYNNVIKNHGLRSNLNDQAGIDIRGFANVTGNEVIIFENDTPDGNVRVGIRARPFGPGETFGGSYTRIDNNLVRSNNKGSTRGIMAQASGVLVSNNDLVGLFHGVRFGLGADVSCRADNNSAINCANAYTTDVGTPGIAMDGNSAQECTTMFNIAGSDAFISDLRGQNNTNTIAFAASSSNNYVLGGRLTGSSAVPLSDAGSNNKVHRVLGIRTRYRGQTASFSVTTTGVRNVVTPHNLNSAIAATLNTTQVLAMLSSTVNNYAATVTVASIDATNITFNVNVTTASPTGGATARLNIDIDAESL